jgi:hypothetical protein
MALPGLDDRPAIDDRHYVPILKARAAECDAVGVLPPEQKAALTPLFELMPIPWDVAEDRATANGDEHVESAVTTLRRAWGAGRPMLVDLLWLGAEARLIDGRDPMALLLERAAETGLRVVPVTGLDRDAAYQGAVRDGRRDDGIALRLTSADLIQVTVRESLVTLLETLGVSHADVDVIVDLKDLNRAAVDFSVMGGLGVIAAVPDVSSWRSLTLAGSAFPETLGEMEPSSETRIARAEWSVWSELRQRGLPRTPAFADYAIAHPNPPTAVDPRLLRVSAQLRYTREDDWLVFKGRNIRDYGNDQFILICEKLVASGEFRGAEFSWGDSYIAERASGADRRPGNPRTWRKVGTSHHIATVVSQIASLGS